MKKLFIKTIIILSICLALIIVGFYLCYFIMSPIFGSSYQKGFNYQYKALEKAESPKIIVLGGSYMTFATNSDLLKQLTEIPSYTLGIHSGMGMCYIIETAEKFIQDGDIVVYSLYPNCQVTKNDYGMDLIYQCFENDKQLFFSFAKVHPFVAAKKFALAIYTKLYNKFSDFIRVSILHKTLLDEDSVYNAAAFDKISGNLIYPRHEIDPSTTADNFIPTLKYDISDIDKSSISILNDLNNFCIKKGATLYITWSPVYNGFVASSDEDKQLYETYYAENLDAPIISTLKDNEFSKDCVYNGALHMNDKGAELYTKQIYEDLKKYLNK